MLAACAQRLDARFGERVDSAFRVDGQAIGIGHGFGIGWNRAITSNVAREYPAIGKPAVGKDVERVRVNASGVVDVQNLLVSTQLHAVRPCVVISHADGTATRRLVVDGGSS